MTRWPVPPLERREDPISESRHTPLTIAAKTAEVLAHNKEVSWAPLGNESLRRSIQSHIDRTFHDERARPTDFPIMGLTSLPYGVAYLRIFAVPILGTRGISTRAEKGSSARDKGGVR
jgi:hypothetical protein